MRNAFESSRGDTQVIELNFGPMPENPSNTSEKDIKALKEYYENYQDKFPSSKYIDVREWENWRDISLVYNNLINKWQVSYKSLIKGKYEFNEFNSRDEAQAELDKLKNYNKQIALDLIREARNFAIGEDLEAPWTDDISQSDGGEVNGTAGTDQEDQPDVGTGDAIKPEFVTTNGLESTVNNGGVDNLVENLPEVAGLQAELDRLIEVGVAKLQREQNIENFSYKIDREKLQNFKENARKAIADYQQFASKHSSPIDKYNPQIQERYQLLEKEALKSLDNLANLLDGEIVTLPQDRDIQLSHPGGVDTRQYLEARGYKFDENGDITHITNNGVEIELNRAMKTDILIKSLRPSHIVYDKSIYLDNNINYKGYLVRALNQQTPDFIVGVLDNNNLEPVILDEIVQSNNTSESIQDPWSTESKIETEFENIFADSLERNYVLQGDNEIQDPWVEKSVTKEPPITPVFPIPSGANPDLQSEPKYSLGDEGFEVTPQVSLDDLRLAYAKAEETWNRKRGDEKLEDAFEEAREAYNTELERVLKLKVAEGQEANIHQIFKNEVIALRDSRIDQSQELQGKWEKRLNPIKEKFVNFVVKHKKIISRLNLAAGVAGGTLALTGVGIPLAGGLAVARRMVSATLLGVSTGEGIRSLGEDADINSFWGKIKFQAVIPKIVKESITVSSEEMKQVSEDVLKERLGTLEAYYRLNGGKFTNDNQQQAYEKVLTELARRVQENVIYVENNKDTSQSDWQEQKPQELTDVEIENLADENLSKRNIIAKSMPFSREREIERQYDLVYEKDINWEKLNPERYTSELLNIISDKRVTELDKFRRNRRNATVVGLGLGLLVGGAVHLSDEFNQPDAEESLRQAQEAEAAAERAKELAQDVSILDSTETIWREIAEKLGENASQAQIQQALENYLQSELGQESIYKLAQGTKGGKELLSQWGVYNADAMANLSKDQLFEISRYLAPGELEGITRLSLDNLDALDPAVAPEVTGAPTIEPGSPEPPAPPASESAVVPPTSEAPTVSPSEFTRDLSEILGKQNLTAIQAREIVQSYFADDYGRVAIYNSIINTDEGARFLSQGFNIKNPADFANLTPDKMYEITNSLDADSWRRIINETVLSKFETADIVEIAKGDSPLGAINRYIAGEVGNLPYDANLGKQVLDTYIQTDTGKQWLYDAIVSNPNPNNQNVQLFREYLRFKDIKSPEEFVTKFNWSEFSGNRNIPTSGFWNQIRLPNGGAKLQPLSTFLQPSKMTGIPDVIKQVLTK